MLKRFEVENFKNFKDKLVFDLSETKNYEFNPECVQNGLVSKAIIYGVNGCGKSNLGLAIFDLVAHLTDKTKDQSLYQNYLNADTATGSIAQFKYLFSFNDSVLEYSYGKIDQGFIFSESLKINDEEVLSYHFGKLIETNLKGTETLNKDLGSSLLSALKYIRSNAILTEERTKNLLDQFFKFVDGMLFFRSVENNRFIGYENENDDIVRYIVNKGLMQNFEAFLNNAGVECKLTTFELNGLQSIAFEFAHGTREFWLLASTGTKSLALFYYWTQKTKEKGDLSFVFIDEFDAFYHHKLSQLIVSELKNVSAQVILTTHNTSIMTNDLLRPDCYFVMHENKIDPIYKFTDKELRFAHNIENMFRRGAFNG